MVQRYTRLSKDTFAGRLDLGKPATAGRKYYVTVRCHNRIGLSTFKSSNGVIIVKDAPSADSASVTVVVPAYSPYPRRGLYQTEKKSLRVAWDGFYDALGIARYEVQ